MEVSLKQRNKTFDLIRVIAIFAIICGHMYTFANFNDVLATDTSAQFYLSHFLKAIGLVENNIFFLITGVYSVSSDYKKALNKVVSLYTKIYVVSVLCFVFFTIVWHIPINIDFLCITFAPFSMNGYWFLSVFITVLLLSPFVNAAWNIIERKYAFAVYGIFFYTDCVDSIYFWRREGYQWRGVFCSFWSITFHNWKNNWRIWREIQKFKIYWVGVHASLSGCIFV